MTKSIEEFVSKNIMTMTAVVVFIFGVGVSWAKVASEADKTRQEVVSLNTTLVLRIESMRIERELKLAIISQQLQATDSRVLALEQERVEQRAIASRLAALEAKLTGVQDTLTIISRKL